MYEEDIHTGLSALINNNKAITKPPYHAKTLHYIATFIYTILT
jgi:hypothetical protein